MIIDKNLVFVEKPVTGTELSNPVPLTSLLIPGRAEPIPVLIQVTETFNNLTTLTFTLQQADARDGTYTDVGASMVVVPLAELTAGAKIGGRFLPRTTTKPWLKLAYAVTGAAPTAGAIFAALTREEDEPYTSGQYIDKGFVEG